ncbi:MAG: hypothetical protein LBC99_04060 [Spirochaetota bacterium]|nr:hypothetical protein [Spirochaetota bacterium]
MKKLLIPFMLIVLASCGSAKATGFTFKAGNESYIWARGETEIFSESGIAIQDKEEDVYRLSMIASRDILKSGEKVSDNSISLGIKKAGASKEPVWAGKNSGHVVFWLDGKKYVGPVDIDIAKFGKVGKLVTGKFNGKAGEMPLAGAFSLQRIDDKALQEGKKN